jgi:hypothetical protein
MHVIPLPHHEVGEREKQLVVAEKAVNAAKTADERVAAYTELLTKYPDYAAAYLLRLGEECDGTDRKAIAADLDHGLTAMYRNLVDDDQVRFMHSVQARQTYLSGDYSKAVDQLWSALDIDSVAAPNLFSYGGTSTEKIPECTWTEADLTDLVQRFPRARSRKKGG